MGQINIFVPVKISSIFIESFSSLMLASSLSLNSELVNVKEW